VDVRKIARSRQSDREESARVGIRKGGDDLARLDEAFLDRGSASGTGAGRQIARRGRGRLVRFRASAPATIPSRSATSSTFDCRHLATPARLIRAGAASEKWAAACVKHGLFSRTVQLKLRYSDFSTFTRAHTLDHATDIDIDLLEHARRAVSQELEREAVRLVGVHAGSLEAAEGQFEPASKASARSAGARRWSGRQDPRPLRRVKRLARQRHEGDLRRARPRKPRRPAGEGTRKS